MIERKEKIKFPASLTWKNFCPKSKYGKQFSQAIDKAVWVKHQRENFLDYVVIWYPLFNSTRSMICHRKTPPKNPKQQKREKVWPLFCQQKKKMFDSCNKPTKALIRSSSLSWCSAAGLGAGGGDGELFVPSMSYGVMDWASRFTKVLTLNQAETMHFGAQLPIMHTLRSMHTAEKVYRKQYSKYIFSKES